MSNRLFFVVVMLIGLAVLLPLSQYFGGPIFGSGVMIDQVGVGNNQRVDIKGTMQPDAMARMHFQWMDDRTQPATALSEQVFFAMAIPYGPNGMTPTFIAYTTADGQLIGLAQRSAPNEILILLNRNTNETWPSPAVLDKIGRGERDGVEVDVLTEAQGWLNTLQAAHPTLSNQLILPPQRELVVPKELAEPVEAQ